jgi:hypothetical protein
MSSTLNWSSIKVKGMKVIDLAVIFLILTLIIFLSSKFTDLNILLGVEQMFDKLTTRGGEGRNQQSYLFIEGIFENYGLGAGHGIGVSFAVHDKYPWRYEMIWLASLYRVGFLGAFVYALPFIFVLFSEGRHLIKGKLNSNEKFLYGGLLCSFIATNTNPYIEGYVFQWMFVLPVVYFTLPHKIKQIKI